MANNPQDKGSYHEIPACKYIFLFGTAIHKKFFLWWTLLNTGFWYGFTRFFGWDTRLWGYITLAPSYAVENPLTTVVLIGSFILAVFAVVKVNGKQKRDREAVARARQRLNGGEYQF